MEYELYKNPHKEWRWRLKAKNGEIIAASSEGYKNRVDCLHSIQLVQNAGDAPVKNLSKD